jgi:hypothetical protein
MLSLGVFRKPNPLHCGRAHFSFEVPGTKWHGRYDDYMDGPIFSSWQGWVVLAVVGAVPLLFSAVAVIAMLRASWRKPD